ncbi:MAG TPA: MBL fold metallo-hydrolase [Clostridiales bacterium]|nr:MBL fold metallo-hydrolase [Clostridiales bacterium]
MKLTFNGTSAAEGFPALFCECRHCQKARELGGKNVRTRTSCLIDDQYLIDFPPDTYMHVLHGKLKLSKIKHIIVTHSHEDHFQPYELLMRRPPFAYPGEDEILYVYGNDGVYEKFVQAGCTNENNKKYLQYVHVYPGKQFKAGEANVLPLRADHTNGNEICHIYIINIGEKHLLYGHDTGYFPEETWEALRSIKLDGVILDCTCGTIECERGHMGITANVKVKERLIEQGSADEKTTFIVTHFSHNCGPLYDDMVKLAGENGFIATFDGMEINI